MTLWTNTIDVCPENKTNNDKPEFLLQFYIALVLADYSTLQVFNLLLRLEFLRFLKVTGICFHAVKCIWIQIKMRLHVCLRHILLNFNFNFIGLH
jgi:hypothetical protein